MLTTILGLVPGVLSIVGGAAFALYHLLSAHRDAMNSPTMMAAAQAKTDVQIEDQAEKAVEASDKGDLTLERKGDAE